MASKNKNEFSDLVEETLSEDKFSEEKTIKGLVIELSMNGEKLESHDPFFSLRYDDLVKYSQKKELFAMSIYCLKEKFSEFFCRYVKIPKMNIIYVKKMSGENFLMFGDCQKEMLEELVEYSSNKKLAG